MLIILTATLVMEAQADPTTRDSRCALAAPGQSCCGTKFHGGGRVCISAAAFLHVLHSGCRGMHDLCGVHELLWGCPELQGASTALGCAAPSSSFDLASPASQPVLGLVPSMVL